MIPLIAALLTCLICFLTLLEVLNTVLTIVVYSHRIIEIAKLSINCLNVNSSCQSFVLTYITVNLKFFIVF